MNLKTLAGANGEAPVFDGTMRGAIVVLLNITIGLASTVVDISAEQLAYIYAGLNPLTFIMFGIADLFLKRQSGSTQPATRPD